MKLSIVIPTFNRCRELIKQLNELIIQIENLKTSEIELLVSDNCSTDETQKNATEKILNLKYAHYYRNESNLGFDRNCEILLRRATGDYVWFISDDDLLSNDAVREVLTALQRSGPVAFCYVNYKIDINGEVEPSRCGVVSDGIYDYADYITKSGMAFSFISSCVINKNLWKLGNYEQYLGTKWYHAFVVRDLIVGEKVYVLTKPLVTMYGLGIVESRTEKRKSPECKYDFYMEAYISLFNYALGMSKVGYCKETANTTFEFVRKDELRQILYYKATSPLYRIGEILYYIRRLSSFNSKKVSHWLLCVPALLLPSFIVGNFYWWMSPIYKKIKNKK